MLSIKVSQDLIELGLHFTNLEILIFCLRLFIHLLVFALVSLHVLEDLHTGLILHVSRVVGRLDFADVLNHARVLLSNSLFVLYSVDTYLFEVSILGCLLCLNLELPCIFLKIQALYALKSSAFHL